MRDVEAQRDQRYLLVLGKRNLDRHPILIADRSGDVTLAGDVLNEVDARLTELRRQRDELQAQLSAGHEKGNAWIEKVIRSFELIELLQEAILFGSSRPRDMALRAIASNYSVEGKKLVWKPRAPFRQAAQRAEGTAPAAAGQRQPRPLRRP